MKRLLVMVMLLLIPSCVPYRGITKAEKQNLKKRIWVEATPHSKPSIWKKPKRKCNAYQ